MEARRGLDELSATEDRLFSGCGYEEEVAGARERKKEGRRSARAARAKSRDIVNVVNV